MCVMFTVHYVTHTLCQTGSSKAVAKQKKRQQKEVRSFMATNAEGETETACRKKGL